MGWTEARTSRRKVRLSLSSRQGRNIVALISCGDDAVEFLRLGVKRFHVVQGDFVRDAIEHVANAIHPAPHLLKQWFARYRWRKSRQFLGKVIDHVALPENCGAVGGVITFDGARANLQTAEPPAEADQMRHLL